MIEEAKVKKIKEATERTRGTAAAVAKSIGVTRSYVSMVLSGKRNSLAVVEAAAKEAKLREEQRLSRIESINQLADSIS